MTTPLERQLADALRTIVDRDLTYYDGMVMHGQITSRDIRLACEVLAKFDASASDQQPADDKAALTDPDSGRHGPNENRHAVLSAMGGKLDNLYPLYELWRFERLARDGL